MRERSPLRSFCMRLLGCVALLCALELLARIATRPRSPLPPSGPEVAAYGRDRLVASDILLWTPDAGWNLEQSATATLRIAVLGEGTSCSPAVTPEQTWPRLLARLFDRAFGIQGVDVRTYSSPGFSAAQGEVVLERVLSSFQPHIVIFQFGNGNEVDPAIGGRRDAEWLARPQPGSLAAYSALVRVVRPLLDDAVRERGSPPGSVRQDRNDYEATLARMIARVRENGCCPALVEPVHRPPLDPRRSLTDVVEVYRLATAKVAGLYGAPLITLRESMLADANAFQATSNAWSERGHRVAARQAFRTLCSDSSFLLAMRRWLERAGDDGRWKAIAGTFALLHSIHESSPATLPASSALEPLNSAARSQESLKAAAGVRLALVRWKGADLDAIPAILDDLAIAQTDRLAGAIHAAASIMIGRGEEARTNLLKSLDEKPTRENAIAHLLYGISLFSSDPEAARAAFRSSILCDPALGLADLWLAKSYFLSGNLAEGRLAFRLGRRTLTAHSGAWSGVAITRADDDVSVDDCLRDEPTLFGRDQRDALGRLLFARFVDAEVETVDEFLLLDRYLITRTSDPRAIDPAALSVLEQRALALSDDRLIALAATALMGSDFELAAQFGEAALAKRETPEAHRVCGMIEVERHAPMAAIEHLEKIEGWNEDPRLVTLMVRCERDLGNLDRARELLNEALARWPSRSDFAAQLAQLEATDSG